MGKENCQKKKKSTLSAPDDSTYNKPVQSGPEIACKCIILGLQPLPMYDIELMYRLMHWDKAFKSKIPPSDLENKVLIFRYTQSHIGHVKDLVEESESRGWDTSYKDGCENNIIAFVWKSLTAAFHEYGTLTIDSESDSSDDTSSNNFNITNINSTESTSPASAHETSLPEKSNTAMEEDQHVTSNSDDNDIDMEPHQENESATEENPELSSSNCSPPAATMTVINNKESESIMKSSEAETATATRGQKRKASKDTEETNTRQKEQENYLTPRKKAPVPEPASPVPSPRRSKRGLSPGKYTA